MSEELETLSRNQLNERAEALGLNPADYSNKQKVLNAILEASETQTPPEGENATDPALTPTSEPEVSKKDPALTPSDGTEKVGELHEGDPVLYPYSEAQSGYRRSYVVQVKADSCVVVYADGSRREFSKNLLKKG